MKRRIGTLALTILFCAALLASAAFIGLYSAHDCCHEDCRICPQLAACGAALMKVSALAVMVCLSAAPRGERMATAAIARDDHRSLVAKKVELRD